MHHGKKMVVLGAALIAGGIAQSVHAQEDKPTGAPLVLSSVETEQSLPLAILDPDGKTARCVTIRLHWNPKPDAGADDDAAGFELDIKPDAPGASLFTAQLWNASLAGAMAWQQPWEGARWKVLQTPATDGSGIDAALAVGMIATSARRPYPKETLVIGSLNPDGSLGPVSHLADRMDAAAAGGVITRVIIPSVQRFDTDDSGQVLNVVHHASDLHLECVSADNIVEATQKAMNDPLPDSTLGSSTPKYSNDIATYIETFAHHEQNETTSGLEFAPKEAGLSKYPPRTAAIWKSVYADYAAGQEAYRAGQVYVAFLLFTRANSRMHGINALVGQSRTTFNVKASLAESESLRQRVHDLMSSPAIDKGELGGGLLVAEMTDWAYDINAALEGAQLVTKQAFSQRSDATEAEKDRAREAILFAIEQSKYLLDKADFYNGLAARVGSDNLSPANGNAEHLLPQLIPAQLATARIFTDGIRQRANDLRDGLLFDPRLVAYVSILSEAKADWDARQHKKELEAATAAANAAATASPAATKPGTSGASALVGFDPGNTFAPPHTVLISGGSGKKLSGVASCLVWANHDCEIAMLDEKYLRLSGTIDAATREWHVKDRAKLDALLQLAEVGARHGIAFAEKAKIDSSVLEMIYEKAGHLRIQDDDASALEALRHYWRCALLGNICWQLAHGLKALPADMAAHASPADTGGKTAQDGDGKKPDDKIAAKTDDKTKLAGSVAVTEKAPADSGQKDQAEKIEKIPSPPPAVTNDTLVVNPPPAPDQAKAPPRALPVTEDAGTNSAPQPAPPAPPVASTGTNSEPDIPVAPVAKTEDYTGGDSATPTPPHTNAAPVLSPAPPPSDGGQASGSEP